MNPEELQPANQPSTDNPPLPAAAPQAEGAPPFANPFADLPGQLNEAESQVYWDMQWAMFDPEVQELYPDKVVAVHRRRVIAAGDDYRAVLQEAERITGLPRNHIAILGILGPRGMLED